MIRTNRDPFYAWLDNERIREIIHRAGALTPGERLVLVKGLVPGLVDALGVAGFEDFLAEVRVKARRFGEARAHPGMGYGTRRTPGEALGGPTPEGHLHWNGARDPHRPGGRAAERIEEARRWAKYRRPIPGR
ncbi:MAG TPA: hypothetical protein VF188_02105 [Longimicrobiales bacterium]